MSEFAKRVYSTRVTVMTAREVILIRISFQKLEAISSIASLTFYQVLLEVDPTLRSLFTNDIEEQGRNFMFALRFVVDTLETPHLMIPTLESLGRRHASYGVTDEHWLKGQIALFGMLERTLGRGFDAETRAAWKAAYEFVSEVMKRAAGTVGRTESDYRIPFISRLPPPPVAGS